jgi:hypothetical protein
VENVHVHVSKTKVSLLAKNTNFAARLLDNKASGDQNVNCFESNLLENLVSIEFFFELFLA